MRYICAIFAVLMISTLCYSQTSPNSTPQPPADTFPASPNTPPAQPSLTPSQPSSQSTPAEPTTTQSQPNIANSDETLLAERNAYKQVVEAHQKTLDTIKWTIGIILAIFGLVLFRNTRDYKEAVAEAKKACEDTQKWEQQSKTILDSLDSRTKEKLDSIDTRAENKLKEIEERVKIELKQIEKQSNKSLVDIWDEQRINTLWSTALMLDKEGKHEEAGKVFNELDKLVKGNAAYNQACQYALWGNKERCRKWLLVGQEAGTLVTRDIAMKDRDLDSVREEPWFKEIKWKG